MEQMQIQFAIIINRSLQKRFINGFIRILQFHIFADQSNLHNLGRIRLPLQKLTPSLHLRCRTDLQTNLPQNHFVHLLTLQHQRHLINRRDVDGLNHRILRHVTKQSDLAQYRVTQLMLRTQHQDIRLYTRFLQLLNRMLRRFRLIFFCCSNIRDIRQMHAQAVSSQLPLQLAHTFNERKRFYVTNRSTDFRNHEIKLVLTSQHLYIALNLIRDMRHDLHGLPQIISFALFVNYTLINTPRRDVVRTRCLNI